MMLIPFDRCGSRLALGNVTSTSPMGGKSTPASSTQATTLSARRT
jgi:hypothetical protein